MFAVFSAILVTDTKITFVYNSVAPLDIFTKKFHDRHLAWF